MITAFKIWLENVDSALFNALFLNESALSGQNSVARMKVGHANERIVRFSLLRLNNPPVPILPVSGFNDMITKIDGKYENGDWIQIKSRDKGSSPEVVSQILLDFDDNKPVDEQMNDSKQRKGKDWTSKPKHVLFLPESQDMVYECDGPHLHSLIEEALNELKNDPVKNGYLSHKQKKGFTARNGVRLSPSFEPNDTHSKSKILAYTHISLCKVTRRFKADKDVDQTPIRDKVTPQGFTLVEKEEKPPESDPIIFMAEKQLEDYFDEKIDQIEISIPSTKLDKNKDIVNKLTKWAESKPLKFTKENKHKDPRIVTKMIFTL